MLSFYLWGNIKVVYLMLTRDVKGGVCKVSMKDRRVLEKLIVDTHTHTMKDLLVLEKLIVYTHTHTQTPFAFVADD